MRLATESWKHAHRAVYIFHAHVYFQPDEIECARQFRQQLQEAFGADSRAHFGTVHEVPLGPHPCGNYEFAFTRDLTADVLPWLQLNRPSSLPILIHPFTSNFVRPCAHEPTLNSVQDASRHECA